MTQSWFTISCHQVMCTISTWKFFFGEGLPNLKEESGSVLSVCWIIPLCCCDWVPHLYYISQKSLFFSFPVLFTLRPTDLTLRSLGIVCLKTKLKMLVIQIAMAVCGHCITKCSWQFMQAHLEGRFLSLWSRTSSYINQ